ncbi:hypothetical protein EJP82_07650 [Paenibacillus anaericanus]|uniref:DUF4375 domain-containing protein n=1 Tax=Paenibacillus anaericanus TaxID=170367 RepID=A0A3S1DRM5_9BACL|nr:hypothetical protein [Paenibacillus anaericanus]RUT47565.1 hypothetical protein EJP82_07650 [Paenibacillus anaericanus]
MTLVAMKREVFDSLADERLGWACMEPTFMQIRGKDISVKSETISKLTEGQRALCMFRVMYDHAKNSASEYYAWICYLLDIPDFWSGVMNGLNFFRDTSMIGLLNQTKEVLETRNLKLGRQWSDATLLDLDRDNELLNTISRLFGSFQEIAPASLKQISTYIRSNPQEFVILEN